MPEVTNKGNDAKNAPNLTDFAKQSDAPTTTQALQEIELEMKKLELEEKKLAIDLAKANLIDSRERLGERELKRENIRQRSLTNGETLKQLNANEKATQSRCNHKKGGNGIQGIVGGQGDDPQYAVLKHTFANGDTEVHCLRCHKKWKHPARSDHKTEESFQAALTEYRTALNFQTKNSPSSSVVFKFSDNGESFREATKNS